MLSCRLFLIFKNIFFFGLFCLHSCCVQCPLEAREGVGSSGTGVIDGFTLLETKPRSF